MHQAGSRAAGVDVRSRDQQDRRDDDRRRADRERADAEHVERVAAEQGEARAEERAEEVVEPEQLAALRRARAIGEPRGCRDEGDVPAEAEPQQQRGGGERRS